MSYRNIVEKINRDKYSIPSGWDTREKVAEELECSVERVTEILSDAIKAGMIETAKFPVWNPATRQKVMVTCYRKTGGKAQKQDGAPREMPEELVEWIEDNADRFGNDASRIQKSIPTRFRSLSVPVSEIRKLLSLEK